MGGAASLDRAGSGGHVRCMEQRTPPELDMTLDGRFVAAPRPGVVRLTPGMALAVAAGVGVLVLALLVWVAVMLLPVLIVGGLVGWVALRLRGWRRGRSIV